MSMIAETRRAVGWTVRELAEQLGVNASSVTRMEQSERAGTIQLDTLRRALDTMGHQLEIEAVSKRREERVSLELHRAVAEKLRTNPSDVLRLVPANIARLREHVHGRMAHRLLDRWEELSQGPVDELIATMLDRTPEARELRQNNPFAGALTEDERREAIRKANR